MSNQKKKYYFSPKIESVKLDADICLTYSTDPPPDPGSKSGGQGGASFHSPVSPVMTNGPFGSSRPDYGDM